MRPHHVIHPTCAPDADYHLYEAEDEDGEMATEGSSDGEDY